MDGQKDKIRMTKNLGAASNYLTDMADNSNKYLPKNEKIQYINEEEER